MTDYTPPAGDLPPPPQHERGWAYDQPSLYAPQAAAAAGSHVYEAPSTGGELAGFWRRFWARSITTLVTLVIVAIGNAGLLSATLWVHDNLPSDTCFTDANGNRYCEPQTVYLVIGLVITWLFGLSVTYVIWVRRLSTHGATVGMQQMGLSIRTTNNEPRLPVAQALRRNLISLTPIILACGWGWLVLFDPPARTVDIVVAVQALLALIVLLSGLPMLFSSRKQTLWDMVGDTVVVSDAEPSWLSVAALIAGLLVPIAVAVTVFVVGGAELHRRYDDVVDGSAPAARTIVIVLPVVIASVVAIALGHLALRRTQWAGQRPTGRGIARTGSVLGYAVPLLTVIAVSSAVIYHRVQAGKERTCAETRKELRTAIASYNTLNQRLPTNIAALNGPIYLDDPAISETWELEEATADPFYKLVGKGDCSKA